MWKRTGKRIGKDRILGILFGILLSLPCSGQEVKTSVNKNPVQPGQRFKYIIELENVKGRINTPDLSEFPKVYSPSKSREVQMVNGQVSQRTKISYTIQAPEEEGSIRIGAVKVKTQDGVLKGSPIDLRIKGDVQQRGKGDEQKSPSTSGANNEALIAKVRLNKSSAYKGEAVRVTYLLYSRYRNLKLTQNPTFPSINGAWSEEVDEESGWKGSPVKIDGKAYRKAILRRKLIFPQQTGKLKIDPMEVKCRVNRGFFSKGKKVEVRSNSPELQVKPLPPGAPEHFDGAVGNYDLRAGLDRDSVKTNGSANLRVKVTGSGNLHLLGEPKVQIPADLEHYDPNVSERTEIGPSNMRGKKEWEYLIVPRQSGKYTIEPVPFSYFDPQEERYRTLRSDAFELKVQEGKAKGTQVPKGRQKEAKEQVNVLEERLRYIRPELKDLRERGREEKGSALFLPFLPPFLGAIFLLVARKRSEKEKAGSSKERKTARARLRDAEKALKQGDRAAFHEELYKGLHSYLSDRTGIPGSEFQKERLRKRMEEMGVPEELVRKSLRTLEHSEMLRYAPSQNISDEAVHEETVSLLAELERYCK